jgi:YggT family protein
VSSAKDVLCTAINIYLLILLARAILSWFPVQSSEGGFAAVQRVLWQLTEPILAPARRVIPPAGMFDLSFIVVFIGILIVHSLIGCSGGL